MFLDSFARKSEYAPFVLRLGLALTILYSVKTKLAETMKVAGLFGKAGFPQSEGLVTLMAIVLALAAIMLILGFRVRIAAAFLTIFFVITLLTAFSVGPAVWKDFALLGGSVSLLLSGAGSVLAIDAKKNTTHTDQIQTTEKNVQ